MGKKTQYIIDAIQSGGPKQTVKVKINGVVTMASASLALEQLQKPKNARKPSWVNAEPCEDEPTKELVKVDIEIHPVTEATIVEEDVVQDEETIMEEEVQQPKRKKKQIEE